MRKRRVILSLLVVVVVAVLVAVFTREREPEYGGKRLSEWVSEWDKTDAREFVSVGDHERRPAHPLPPIGTNAIPYLLKCIRYETPMWKRRVYIFNWKLPNEWLISKFGDDEKQLRAEGAELALIGLGPAAKGAIPQLTQVLSDPKAYQGASRAAHILSALGNDGLAALLAVLTNQQTTAPCRITVLLNLGSLGTNAQAAIPALQNLVVDPDLNIRIKATIALRKIKGQPLE